MIVESLASNWGAAVEQQCTVSQHRDQESPSEPVPAPGTTTLGSDGITLYFAGFTTPTLIISNIIQIPLLPHLSIYDQTRVLALSLLLELMSVLVRSNIGTCYQLINGSPGSTQGWLMLLYFRSFIIRYTAILLPGINEKNILRTITFFIHLWFTVLLSSAYGDKSHSKNLPVLVWAHLELPSVFL